MEGDDACFSIVHNDSVQEAVDALGEEKGVLVAHSPELNNSLSKSFKSPPRVPSVARELLGIDQGKPERLSAEPDDINIRFENSEEINVEIVQPKKDGKNHQLLSETNRHSGYGLLSRERLYESVDKHHDHRKVKSSTIGELDFGPDENDASVLSPTPEHLALPCDGGVRLTKSGVFLLNLFWFGISLMYLVLSVEVVPAQMESLVGQESKGRCLGGMVAGGAVIQLVLNPIMGMVSDRGLLRHPSILRFGKRRPLMVLGCLGLCFGLFGMALSAPQITFQLQEPARIGDVLFHNTSGFNNGNLNSTNCIKPDLKERRCAPFKNKSYQNAIFGPSDQREHRVPPISSIQYPQGEMYHNWTTHGDPPVTIHGPYGEPYMGNIALFIIFYLWAQTCLTVIGIAYNGLIADMSPPTQRGLNSGVMGGMILSGHVAGALLGVWFTQIGVLTMYICVAVVMLTTGAATVLTTLEVPAKYIQEPCSLKKLITAFLEPLREHDFRLVFFTRFLMQLGVTSITAFTQYWLADMIVLPDCWSPSRAVAVMLSPLLLVAAISSVPCGILSDRMQRRKPLVISSGILMTFISCFMIVFSVVHTDYVYYGIVVMAALYGIGFGAFLSVDYALVLDVLPDYSHAAKDIAIWQLALVLPQALAAPIGGIVVDLFEKVNCEIGLGYIILFVTTALYFFLSAFFVTFIKNVK